MSEYVYVNAGNDRNGNPRRGWIEYEDGVQVEFHEEGFVGVSALPPFARDAGRNAQDTPLRIPVTQYRYLLGLVRSGIPA